VPNTLLNPEHLKGTLILALHAGNYGNELIVLHVAVVILLAFALVIISHRQKQAKLFRNLYESERKQREALNALSVSEKRFGLMVQNTTDIIGTINRDGIVTYVSPTIERVTGCKPEELLVSFLFDIYRRVALTGKPERFETFVEALQMWFSISVYSPAKKHFVAVFDAITGAYTPWASEYLSHVGNLRIEKPVGSADLKRIVMQKVLECRKNQCAVNLEGS